jgi:tRNA pseudouridine55 synthase
VGHLTRLRRTWVEPFRDQPMVALDAALAGASELAGLLPPDAALQALPSAGLSGTQAAAIQQGQAVRHEAAMAGRRVRMYGPDGVFMGLAEGLPDGRLQPRRLLVGASRKPML